MSTMTIDDGKLKELIKTALVEVLETHRDLVQEIVEDAMEDLAFARAMKEGMQSETSSREEVFAILEGEK